MNSINDKVVVTEISAINENAATVETDPVSTPVEASAPAVVAEPAVEENDSVEKEAGDAHKEKARKATEKIVYIDVSKIKPHPKCEGIFHADIDVTASLEEDMKDKGFNIALPLLVTKSDVEDEFLVCDGLTRLESARKAGIEKVPVCVKKFKTDENLIEEVLGIQARRRANSDRVIMSAVIKLLPVERNKAFLRQQRGVADAKGGSVAEILAKKLGKSPSTIKKAVAIADISYLAEAVTANKMSINTAYNKYKKSQEASAPTEAASAEGTTAPSPATEETTPATPSTGESTHSAVPLDNGEKVEVDILKDLLAMIPDASLEQLKATMEKTHSNFVKGLIGSRLETAPETTRTAA